MIRVGFGVTLLARCLNQGGVDGIGNYTRALLNRLNDFETTPVPFSMGVSAENVGCSQVHPLPHYLWSAALGLGSPSAHRLARKVDLVHATDHLIPAIPRVPVLATLMDAIPLSHPEWVSMRFRKAKKAFWKRAARRATRIVTISDYSRHEIAKNFDIPEARIDVVPLGVDGRWSAPLNDAEVESAKSRLALPERYFLTVGTIQPRKNIKRVIDAFCALPESVRDGAQLIVAGRAGWQCEEEVAALSAGLCSGQVRWLQHLSDKDLVIALRHATAMVFPSLSEGFGLPVVEAFAAGTPVISSNTTAIPEVAGDAALLIDPLNTGEISEAMRTVLGDENLRMELAARGRERVQHFTWERTARETAAIYRSMLSG